MMPLSDRDFAEVRANVMREIERRRKRQAWVLGASFAFAMLALAFVLIPRPVQKPAGEIAGATQKPPSPAARLSVAPAPSPAQTVVAAKSLPRKHHRHHHKAPAPVVLASNEQPLTIELQTANPDIRIIWIAK